MVSKLNTDSKKSKQETLKTEKNERMSNTVPANSKKEVEKRPQTPTESAITALEKIKKNERENRVFLDWLSLSLSPLISPSGWKILAAAGDDGEDIKVPYEMDNNEAREFVMTNDGTQYRKYSNLEVLKPDEFFKWFFDTAFTFLGVDSDDYKEGGSGEGYNASRTYTLLSKQKTEIKNYKPTTIMVRYFDPEGATVGKQSQYYNMQSAYADDLPTINYIRQKVNFVFSGDALQALRENNIFIRFLLTLYGRFHTVNVTRFDATLDLFNYTDINTPYFCKLYARDRFLSRSKFNATGDPFEPTVYIGQFKQNRTIMIYNKLLESTRVDENDKPIKKPDEPELLEAVKSNDKNTWLRCEQVYTNKDKEASQTLAHLVGHRWPELNVYGDENDRQKLYDEVQTDFTNRLSKLMHDRFAEKCRFLAKKKTSNKNHLDRIANDKKWQTILDVLENPGDSFTFARPVLTLEDRKRNFVLRSQGGKNLYLDVLEIEGADALQEMLNDAVAHAINSAKYERPEFYAKYQAEVKAKQDEYAKTHRTKKQPKSKILNET